MFESITALVIWIEQKAEPWLKKEVALELSQKRLKLSEWVKDVQSSSRMESKTMPIDDINALREHTLSAIKNALWEGQGDVIGITRKSAW